MRNQFGDPKKKRSLGQVFLKQSWPSVKLARILSELGVEKVLEIGPGSGALTKHLLEMGMQVTAVEKDDRFAEKINESDLKLNPLAGSSLEVINKDILKFDLGAWVESQMGNIAVCGNIPYNISSPIVMKVLPLLSKLNGALFLTQLEFAQRISAEPHTKAYGSLSVYTQLRSHVRMEYKVDKECFTPVPKVDSAVFSLKHRKSHYSDSDLLFAEKVCRQAFNQRRKTLRNSLSVFLKEIDANSIDFDFTRRAETLTPAEFVELAQAISSQTK